MAVVHRGLAGDRCLAGGRPRPGRPDAAPSPAALFAALPAGFQTVAVDFTAGPFARLTYAYPARPPARLDLAVLPVPMRQEVAYWLHTLAVAGERVNSWALAGWVRVAAAVAADGSVSSFTALSVEEWVAAARRRYHDRHHRLPPPSYQHNHRAAIARLHAALTLAYQGGPAVVALVRCGTRGTTGGSRSASTSPWKASG